MLRHLLAECGSDQARALKPLEKCEIEDARKRNTAPHGSQTAERRGIAEREQQAREVHEPDAGCESEHDRQQDRRNDDHCLARVDELRQVGQPEARIGADAVERGGNGGPEQPEDHRHRGRSGQPQRVEQIEQDHVAEHHPQEEHHHLREGELPGIENPAAGHLHHTGRGERSDKDARSSHGEDHPPGRDLRAEGGIEEIDGVVGHADHDAEHGQYGQHDDDKSKERCHKRVSRRPGRRCG